MLVVAVPDLRWTDVAAMPAASALMARSAVGQVAVKTAGTETRCSAGILALSAGNRTSSPTTGCSLTPAQLAAAAVSNRASRYGARLGALGQALATADVPTTAVGSLAVPALVPAGGSPASVRTVPSGDVGAAVSRGGVAVEVLPQLVEPALSRSAARSDVDAALTSAESALPADAVLLVVGSSDGYTGGPQLHVLLISGPGFAHRELTSAQRAPYTQLIDVAPTVLAIEHIAEPQVVVGRAVTVTGSAVQPVSAYIDQAVHATSGRQVGRWFFATLCWVAIAALLLVTAGAGRWYGAFGRYVSVWVATMPPVAMLANALPWWRWPNPVYAAGVFAVSAVVGLGLWLLSRRRPTTGLLLVLGFSFVVVVADQLTGSHLQLSAPLGDDPLTAGRFRGVGNVDFAVLAASAVVLAAVGGEALRAARSRSRWLPVAVAGLVMLVAVVIDGAPPLGDDLGGVVSLVPAAVVLVAMVAGVRLRLGRLIGAVVAAAVVVVGLSLADYSRPAGSQTHAGVFVGQVIHGGAWTVVHRKLDAMLSTLGLTVTTAVIVVAVVCAVVALARVRRSLAATPGLRPALVGGAIAGVLGSVLNDSGTAVAAMMVVVGVMAVVGTAPSLDALASDTGPEPTAVDVGGVAGT